ncbi:hypothetical protein [Flavobacterium sp.]|uniref:hypothetical protein n=1 Tax=Flavobacterium sp. TaxID=239 RepID=UPI00260D8649|nr:hypothetical protein [Flavobacterium sp.]
MTTKNYNKTNFHKYTFCIFNEVDLDAIKDLKMHYKSKSGSCYYFVENGVYRLSNHWSRVANCKWRLVSNSAVTLSAVEVPNSNRTKLGYANWSDFYSDNDVEKIYFLEADYESTTVNFYHKQSSNYSSDKVLRSSSETTKLIKQIRTLFEETAWAKYLNEGNIDNLRQEIIEEMIHSNQSFQEIRRKFL